MAQLERVLASRAFRSARSVSSFLRFVVGKKLAGQEDQLKEYTVGVEVFGRSESFDPKQDGVVRVHARLLRQKLAAYYDGEGRGDPVRIALPKGAYVPTFAPGGDATPPEPGEATGSPVPLPVTPLAAASTPGRPWRSLPGPARSVLAALAGGTLVALVSLSWPGPARQGGTPTPGALWGGFLDGDGETVLAFGVPKFFFTRNGLLVRDLGKAPTDDEQTDRPSPRLLERFGDGALQPFEGYTGVGETYGVHLLTRFFLERGRSLVVARSRNVGWDDLKRGHVIFLASTRFRTLARELNHPADFALGVAGAEGVVNRRPLPGEPPSYEPRFRSDPQIDWAVITLLPGKLPGRRIMVLGGTTTWATQAAAEYVTMPEHLTALAAQLSACDRKAGRTTHPPHLQVLLRVEIKDSQPISVRYETHHDLALPAIGR